MKLISGLCVWIKNLILIIKNWKCDFYYTQYAGSSMEPCTVYNPLKDTVAKDLDI
jgi:hypothetical protein